MLLSTFIISPGPDLGGANGQGEKRISEIDIDHQTWFKSFRSPLGETEPPPFAIRAAFGASIIGWFADSEQGKRSVKSCKEVSLDKVEGWPRIQEVSSRAGGGKSKSRHHTLTEHIHADRKGEKAGISECEDMLHRTAAKGLFLAVLDPMLWPSYLAIRLFDSTASGQRPNEQVHP